MNRRNLIFTLLAILSILLYPSCTKGEIVTVNGDYYEMSFYMPAKFEKRLDEWDEWLLPPEGQKFIWIYVLFKSTIENPIDLYWDDYVLSYSLSETERYTTTLVAIGNNDVYMRAPVDWNYGGVTDADGFGGRYVFSVPLDAHDFQLEITSLPPVELTIR